MIERLLNPIKARIRLMVGKCLITACCGNVANLSLLAGESREDVDFYQQYGFSSRPKGKVAGVALFIGGSRDNGVVVATRGEDGEMGVNLEPGEVAMHSPFGSKIVLLKDGSISAVPASGKKTVVESDLLVKGKMLSTGDAVAGVTEVGGNVFETGGVSLKLHTHPTAVVGAPSTPTPIVGG